MTNYKAAIPKHKMIDPVEDYGIIIGSIVQRKLDILVKANGDGCIDNFRWAKASRRCENRRYYKARKNGCCGAEDSSFYIFFTKYLIGFNYGH